MNWFLWFVAAWWLFNAAACTAMVGKPRKPLTGFDAAAQVVWYSLLIAGLFFFGVK